MFGKMMNRYYYGKSGKGDFTKDDLPTNRWQLFWEMLRIRFMGLIKLNLMYVLAWLPTLFVIGYSVMVFWNYLQLQAGIAAGEVALETYTATNPNFEAEMAALPQNLLLQTLLFLIPCIAITGPFTAGVCYVTRNWARDEHAFIWSDFKDAVKANWKQALACSAITSVMPLILYECYVFYGQMASTQSAFFIVPQVLCIMLVLIWMSSLMYIYPQMVTYNMKFKDLVRNSLFMSVARLPMTVGLKLLSLLPVALCLVIMLFTPYAQYAMLVLLLYYLIVGYALSRFVGASYTNAVFDRYINTRIEGAKVNRGLYVDDDDEEASEGEKLTEGGAPASEVNDPSNSDRRGE